MILSTRFVGRLRFHFGPIGVTLFVDRSLSRRVTTSVIIGTINMDCHFTGVFHTFRLRARVQTRRLFSVFTSTRFTGVLRVECTFRGRGALSVFVNILRFVGEFVMFRIVRAFRTPIFRRSHVRGVLIGYSGLISRWLVRVVCCLGVAFRCVSPPLSRLRHE